MMKANIDFIISNWQIEKYTPAYIIAYELPVSSTLRYTDK